MKELEKSALLEIGTEEIPASYCVMAVEFIRSYCEERLRFQKLPYKEIQVLGTPRRLALLIFGIPARTPAQEEEFWGPPLTKAKDTDGKWTQAAIGFARSQGTTVENLSVRTKKEVPTLCFVMKHRGKPCETILKEIFTSLIDAIPFPKKMVWDETLIRFARPIRNLVALMDKQLLRISVGRVKSSNKSLGLSRIHPKPIPISSPQTYVSTLKNHCILVDPQMRKATLLKGATQLVERTGGKLPEDESLLEEVTWLVEHPVATLGHFDPKFLELPSEVLTICMRKQQKFFSVLDTKGSLTSHFIAIRNGVSEHQDIVRKGYEKVLAARLSDAQFFFNEDLKKPLDFYTKKCEGIVVQEKLGTLKNKIERIDRIAKCCIAELNLTHKNDNPSEEIVGKTVQIFKFDCATQMVYEFPELQGVMGETYARRYGVEDVVAEAIREHYLPLTNQGEIPKGPLSCVVAIADKLDQLVGSFLIGRSPTGNSDPYGLRRASTGILRIILENRWELSLSRCLMTSLSFFPISLVESTKNVGPQVGDFFLERFALLLQDLGFAQDEIYAVTKNRSQKDVIDLNISHLQQKCTALREIRSHPDFDAIAASFKRVSNILKQARSKNLTYSAEKFDSNLLKEEGEFDLYREFTVSGERAKAKIVEKKFKEALLDLVHFRKVLDTFFEKVMVMVEDSQTRSNRLSLLSLLENLFKEVADFSYLQNRTS